MENIMESAEFFFISRFRTIIVYLLKFVVNASAVKVCFCNTNENKREYCYWEWELEKCIILIGLIDIATKLTYMKNKHHVHLPPLNFSFYIYQKKIKNSQNFRKNEKQDVGMFT